MGYEDHLAASDTEPELVATPELVDPNTVGATVVRVESRFERFKQFMGGVVAALGESEADSTHPHPF